ncbi:exported protein of unknown function [Candidatus Hydrogenisulfobacillus filiaventi]|uniref:Uncharacterized protein n=1 Tax=Candidatus Hydrogenisulfobacillus filiaventi TaxID=2707344 RepID=A0A6F8ZJ38_9FIRM|nr:hypothetical protein [Bacillota bacterium]CAB1129600.1 exported protein of unknown function [Candidatus Hydrogenisulfobacillus filiaventi]
MPARLPAAVAAALMLTACAGPATLTPQVTVGTTVNRQAAALPVHGTDFRPLTPLYTRV